MKRFCNVNISMTRGVVFLCRLLALLGSAAAGSLAEDKQPSALPAQPAANKPVVELKGNLVPASDKPRADMGFKTESGVVYTLVSNRMSSALFIDTNLQSKTLVLKGRVLPDAHTFEVTGNLRSIRDGKIHELYYYCDVCSIPGSDPGPCMCCREPVYLIEERAGREHAH
jgi:hypothetical protein